MALGRGYAQQQCSLARALEVVGERWTMLILRDCFFGVRRYVDFADHLDIPRAVLMTRLRDLVEQGVLRREPYAPNRGHYVLTERGLALWPALFALLEWGEAGAPDGRVRILRHVACGVDLDSRGWCRGCRSVPPADGLDIRHGPGFVLAQGRTDAVSIALLAPHRLLEPLLGA